MAWHYLYAVEISDRKLDAQMSPIQFIFPMASYATRCKEDAIDRLPLSSMPRSASACKSMNHFVRLILIITCQSNRVRFTSWWGVSRISALVARWTCSARNYSVYNRRLLWGCSCTPAHAHARAVSLTWHKSSRMCTAAIHYAAPVTALHLHAEMYVC